MPCILTLREAKYEAFLQYATFPLEEEGWNFLSSKVGYRQKHKCQYHKEIEEISAAKEVENVYPCNNLNAMLWEETYVK